MITVDDIRRAIQDLPGSSPVLINPISEQDRRMWGFNERSIGGVTGAHDGRFGCVLLLKVDGFVSPYNSGSSS